MTVAPEGLTCGEVATRMITRDPDITRLLDRLKKRSPISRRRKAKDRRIVLTWITPEGLALLARLQRPVREAHREQMGRRHRKLRQRRPLALGKRSLGIGRLSDRVASGVTRQPQNQPAFLKLAERMWHCVGARAATAEL